MFYLFLIPLPLYVQGQVPGEYYNNFGSTLKFNTDSTFEYTWRYDLSGTWTKGTWRLDQDTIYMKTVSVYDTLTYIDENTNSVRDSLVLSLDQKSESITDEEHWTNLLTSGGQNRHPVPEKLYYRKGKLFEIDKNGKLIRKRVRGVWSNKKRIPWYKREKKK